jgi:hypothetical protein
LLFCSPSYAAGASVRYGGNRPIPVILCGKMAPQKR